MNIKNRLDYLDSIRGIAAILVVFYHIKDAILKTGGVSAESIDNLFDYIDLGRLGVVIFFITSGFVIPWSLKEGRPNELKKFMLKRFFRLYPAYWFSIIFSTAIGTTLFAGITVLSFYQVAVNFTMVHKFLGIESVLGSYWTLHLELVFYLACMILFKLGLLHNSYNNCVLVVFFSFLAMLFGIIRYHWGLKLPIIFPLGLSCMFYGAVLRDAILNDSKNSRTNCIILTGIYFILLYFSDTAYYQGGWGKWYLTHVVAFSIFFILTMVLRLHNPVFVFFGRVSYSLYLLHPIAIALIYLIIPDAYWSSVSLFTLLCMVIPSATLLSWLSYKYIEIPFINVAKNK